MLYPKINSLWKRDDDHLLMPGHYSCEEFGSITKWRVEEKIDGTNIVVKFVDGEVSFSGRTKKADIPKHLLEYLTNHFTVDRLASLFPEGKRVTLYGEGYGPKIQTGDFYRPDVSFMLFDILVDHWWFTRDDLQNLGDQLDLPTPPDLGVMTEQEIIDYVKSKPDSLCSIKPQVTEGVICRPQPLMLFRNGKPIMWKLKVKEFN